MCRLVLETVQLCLPSTTTAAVHSLLAALCITGYHALPDAGQEVRRCRRRHCAHHGAGALPQGQAQQLHTAEPSGQLHARLLLSRPLGLLRMSTQLACRACCLLAGLNCWSVKACQPQPAAVHVFTMLRPPTQPIAAVQQGGGGVHEDPRAAVQGPVRSGTVTLAVEAALGPASGGCPQSQMQHSRHHLLLSWLQSSCCFPRR